MTGLMQWRQRSQVDRAKILYVKEPNSKWQPYTLSKWAVVDYSPFAGVQHSAGISTMHRLLQMGYTLVASDPNENEAEDREFQQAQTPKKMPLSGLTEDQRQRWIA